MQLPTHKLTWASCNSLSSLTLSAATYCSEGLAAASHLPSQVRKVESSFSCLVEHIKEMLSAQLPPEQEL